MIKTCLEDVLKNQHIDKVVVVCDRCIDKTQPMVEEISSNSDKCMVVEKTSTKYRKAHLGYYTGEARNAGLKAMAKLHPDYVVLIDADFTLPTDHVFKGVKILNSDSRVGLVGIRIAATENERGSVIDAGSIIRYSIIERWGGIKESARDITTLAKMLIAQGYKTEYITYRDTNSMLAVDPSKDTLRRWYWGHIGIGYAAYTNHASFLFYTIDVLREVILERQFHQILYLIGWLSGYLHRAKRIDELKEYALERLRSRRIAFWYRRR